MGWWLMMMGWTDGTDSVTDRICPVLSDRMCPTRWKSKYSVFNWKLELDGQNNVQHDNVASQNYPKLYSKIPSCYLNSHELTFCSSKSLDFRCKNKLFTFHQIWSKLRCGIGSVRLFQAKTNTLNYNNIPALDSFRENTTDRMCTVTESAPFSLHAR